jgi:TP901 family phage tail tape measure protein
MAKPTLAELQLQIQMQGMGKLAQLTDALKRVGGAEIRRQMDAQARALLGIEQAASKANKPLGLFSGTLGGIAKFGLAAMTIKRSFEFVGGAVSNALDPLIRFQQTMAQVRTKGTYTARDTADLGEFMKQNVREGSQFGINQQAEAAVDLAASNLSPGQVKAVMPTVLRFSQATGASTAESSKMLTNVANMFKTDLSDPVAIEKLAAQINKAANMSTIGVSDIFHTLKYVGTQAGIAGMDPAQVLAMTAILGNQGIVASKAGTGMRNLFAATTRPPRRGKVAAAQLASIGMTQKDIQAGFTDLPRLQEEIGRRIQGWRKGKDGKWVQSAKALSAAQEAAFNSIQYGQYGSTTSAVLTRAASSGVLGEITRRNIKKNDAGEWVFDSKNAIIEFQKAISDTGDSLKETSEIMGEQLAGRLAKVDAKLELLKVTMGERFIPQLEKAIDWADKTAAAVEKWVRQNPEAINQWGRAFESLGMALSNMQPVVGWLADRFADLGMISKPVTRKDVSVEDDANAKKQWIDQWEKQHITGFLTQGQRREAAEEAYRQGPGKADDLETARKRRALEKGGGAENELYGQSRVDLRIHLDDNGKLQAFVDKMSKGEGGPVMRTQVTNAL